MLPANVKPPYDESAERSILGTMLADPENIPTVLEYLTAEDFYLEEHKLLFSVIVKLWQEQGSNWDEVILKGRTQSHSGAFHVPHKGCKGGSGL